MLHVCRRDFQSFVDANHVTVSHIAVNIDRDAAPRFQMATRILTNALMLGPQIVRQSVDIPDRRFRRVAVVNPVRYPDIIRRIGMGTPRRSGRAQTVCTSPMETARVNVLPIHRETPLP